jgi:branched-chain amino acid transport system substrate-binding protein
MSRTRLTTLVIVCSVSIAFSALAGCSNASVTQANNDTAPGVSATEIKVGSIADVTGILSSDFGPVVAGVEAYFSMINAEGGVAGRKLQLAYQEDDQGSPAQDLAAAQALVERDHAFAVVGVATPFFNGASYLAQQGTPTFGYVASTDWQDHPTLFGDYGSVLCFPCAVPDNAYTAKRLGATSVGVLAYGVPQSADACRAWATGMSAYGVNVSFTDLSFPYGSDPTADVLKMKSAGVDLLFTCLDVVGNVSVARALAQNGMNIKQEWFNGYDRSTLQQYALIMQGVYLNLQHVPFEAAAAYPGVYPGLETYIKEMEKYQPSYTYSEIALDGWVAADQFVTGLKAVGKGSLSQKALVDAINKETAFSANGLTDPVDWTTAHTTAGSPFCLASVRVQDGSFVPAFVEGAHEVFNCFKTGSTTPVTPNPGTPGI